MKRTLFLLTCLLALALFVPCPAEELPDIPFLDPFEGRDDGYGFNVPEDADAIEIEVNGERLRLIYDSTPEYSSIQNGMVQASFYAYGTSTDALYELYLTFPDSVREGETVTPDYALQIAADCSVVLIISSHESERYFLSGQLGASAFPESSDYAIRIDAVEPGAEGTQYAGSLSASLVELDLASGEALSELRIEETPFAFTISEGELKESPSPDPGFTPTATPPPDMRRV